MVETKEQMEADQKVEAGEAEMIIDEPLEGGKFSKKRLEQLMLLCATKKRDISAYHFSQMLTELVNLMTQLGSFMKMAFSDVASKAGVIDKNDKHFKDVLKLEGLSVYNQVLKEIELDVIQCNGKTNHKTLKNYKQVKNSWEATYISTGRSLVRMWWFSNFMCSLFELLINKRD